VALLRAAGPTPDAFTFRVHFPPPASGAVDEAVLDEREFCPAGP